MKVDRLSALLENLLARMPVRYRAASAQLVISGLGCAALAGLIWYGGPLLGFGDFHPFEDAAPRLVAILLLVGIVAGFVAIHQRIRRASVDRLAAGLGVQDSDAPVLTERMHEALSMLRGLSGGRANYLYDLPWYVLIGPPGSGKTTALVNSGLHFPLVRGMAPGAIAGVGGTRYCDWWFTEDAVLIDTAGRYTTQDSDSKADQKSWFAFLDLLKRNRPRQPINGVLIAISLEDLLTLTPDELTAHVEAIRSRLIELQQRLKVDLPVYALFTKADLVIGFMEYFNDLDETGRAQVWGTTFRTKDKKRNCVDRIPAEFTALIERLNLALPLKLEVEKDPTNRVLLFGFPAQMAALRNMIGDFLGRIFDPAQYRVNAALRGFYFTSGTQQGTPIDQLLGALAKGFGAEGVAGPVYSGQGKSFFLTDLVKKVIIGEAGWVSNHKFSRLAAVASFAFIFVLTPIVAGSWWVSFTHAGDVIQENKDAAARYRKLVGNLAATQTVDDRDLAKILPALDALRLLPNGYASRGADAATQSDAMGLSQTARLRSAAETAYHVGLERLMRPRLIFRLEEQLEDHINDPEFLFNGLKVYLMLGGLKTVDRQLVISWMEHDWAQNLYPGPKNAAGRKDLEQHLIAMLDLDTGGQRLTSLDGPLVKKCQATLARVDLARHAFDLLVTKAKADLGEEWVAAHHAGEGGLVVFDDTLKTVRVPYFYTRAGFEHAFLGRLDMVVKDMARDRWVLGSAGKSDAATIQYKKLPERLAELYSAGFVAAWQTAIDKLKMRPLLTDRPVYPLLNAAGLMTSPLARLLESIKEETDLRNLPQARTQPDSVARAATSIATALSPYYALVEGNRGRRPIDTIISDLSDLRTNLTRFATAERQNDVMNRRLAGATERLRGDAAKLPEPFANLLGAVASDARREMSRAVVAQAAETLRDQITLTCQATIAGRFPFAPGAPREVALADFIHMFAPHGLIDNFVKQYVLASIDVVGNTWTWRPGTPLAHQLPSKALAEFQRAAKIRDAFFDADSTRLGFSLTVVPPSTSSVRLDVDNTIIDGRNGPSTLQWPGSGAMHRAAIVFEPSNRAASSIEKTGAWAFYRLLDAGHLTRDGWAAFSFGRHDFRFRFESTRRVSPLDFGMLRGFACPGGS